MSDGLGLPALHYLGEQRLALGARRTVEVPSVRYGRFVWSDSCSLLAVGEGVRGRWSCRVAQGEVLLLCPDEQVWVTSLSDHAGELRMLYFETRGEGHGHSIASWVPPVPVRLPGVEPALQARADAANGGSAPLIDFFRIQAHLYELMAAYLSGARRRPGQYSLLSYAEQVRSQMAAHSEREYSIELIARNSGVSPHRFYEAFRLLTGLTPHKYLSALRLRKALRLLAGDFRSVAEVAHAVGYEDEFYFSRVFKRELGLAPSAFVRQIRARPDVNVPCGDLAIFGLAAPPHDSAEPVPESAASPPACPREEEEAPPGAAWSRRVRKLGQLLGLESVAAHWTAIMERRLCHLKGLVRSRFGDTPFLVVGVDTDGYRVFGPRHPGLGDLLYISGGFTPCRTVHGLREVRVASLDEVAAFGCRTALFLVQGRARPSLPAEWADAVGPEGTRCLAVGWCGVEDAARYEWLVERLTLHLLEPEFAADTSG